MLDSAHKEDRLMGHTIRDEHSILSENFSDFDENDFLLSNLFIFNFNISQN